MSIKIVCATKQVHSSGNPLLGLVEFGGVEEETSTVRFFSRDELHEIVRKDKVEVYVFDMFGNKSRLIANVTENGQRYLQAQMNYSTVDPLLTLSTCEILK